MELIVSIQKKLNNFNLNVNFSQHDENLALLGASGAGKSITLKCIAGLITPDSGKIILDGQTLFDSSQNIDLSPQKRQIGYLFQSYALFPNMNVADNIRFVSKGNDAQKEKAVNENLARFSLTDVKDCYPNELSGGQQQRLALARIIAAECKLLLLDEPFSALDTALKTSLELELADFLTQNNKQAILVTHNFNEAYRLTDRIGILERGNLEFVAEKKILLDSPPTVAAAKLIGCKNISKSHRIDEHTLFADDWGLTLKTSCSLPEEFSFLAIKETGSPETSSSAFINEISLPVKSIIQETDSWLMLLDTPNGMPFFLKTKKQPTTKSVVVALSSDKFIFY